MSKKVGIITQGRSTSSRLPGKILLVANNKTILQTHLDRLKASGYQVYVATTTNESDEPIVKLCKEINVPYFRGSESDVLSRYYLCAKQNNLDVVVRVTTDCPLIDGEVVKQGVEKYLELGSENSYVSNCLTRTYPRGFDFEVFSFKALEEAYQNSNLENEKEHVTTYIRNKEKNKLVQFYSVERMGNSSKYRLTLDEKDDWVLLRTLIEDFGCASKSAEEIISVMESHPELHEINAHVEQKKI